MRQRKSKSGQALLLTICIISLGVAITLYAFLATSSTARESARIAATNIDVSQREDVLMRSILHKTAEGMLAGQTWDTILNNALTEMRALSYINPNDLTVLFPNQNIVPANLADTSGNASAILTGFTGTGFTGLIPYAGTSGLSSSTVKTKTRPPLLQYPGGTVGETADRASGLDPVTTPQNLFFKAIYSTANVSTPAALSASSRWGQLAYPNIRFGLEQPGDLFIARRLWWVIPVQFNSSFGSYTGNQQGYAPHTANYILSVYDFPSQLPIKVSGSVNAVIGQEATSETWGNTGTGSTSNVIIDGSIYGDSVQLSGSTFTGNISARTGVSVQQTSTVGSETFSDNTYADLGTRETKDTARTVGAPPVSAAGDGGKVLLSALSSSDSFLKSVTTPTPWDLYSRPYYRCPVRIIVSPPANGNITITIYAQTSTFVGSPDAIMGVQDPTITSGVPSAGWTVQTFTTNFPATTPTNIDSNGALQLTTTATGDPSGEMNLIQIDLSKLPTLVGLSQANMYAVYVGYQPTQPLGSDSTDSGLAVGLTGCKDLHLYTRGLSIVTKQRLYFQGDFNQVALTTPPDANPDDQYPPTSIYAKEVRYSVTQSVPSINFQGRLDIDQLSTSTATQINPLAATSGNSTQISFTQRQFNLYQIKNPLMVPPITRMNLLFTIEKEYTN
jgi:hypothetical protein